MRNHFRVGLRHKRMPGSGEFLLQFAIIGDNAVMNDRERAIAAEMRMRIDLRHAAMRRPARMANADMAKQTLILGRRFHQCHTPDSAHAIDFAVNIDRNP